MDLFNSALSLIRSGIGALGMLTIVWGLVQLGTGFNDHNGSQQRQGVATCVGGIIIVLAAALISQISVSIGG